MSEVVSGREFEFMQRVHAMDMLARAILYVREQWRDDFPRVLAQANLEARALMLNCEHAIYREVERDFPEAAH